MEYAIGFVPNPSGLPKVIGVVQEIGEIESPSEKVKKRKVILDITKETDTAPQELCIELIDFGANLEKGTNVQKLERYKDGETPCPIRVGDTVSIVFYPESRSNTKDGKTSWFTQLSLRVIILLAKGGGAVQNASKEPEKIKEDVPF